MSPYRCLKQSLALALGMGIVGGIGTDPVIAATPRHRIVVHGHRGSRGTRPENSMAAFQEGVAVGVDFLELDLHLTKDGVLVISHDPELTGEKCRDASGEILKTPVHIRDLTLKQLQSYDCGSVPLKNFPEQVLIPHTPHPAFQELVDWVGKMGTPTGVGLNIETKMDEPSKPLNPNPHEFAAKIITVLRKANRIEKDVLQSFDFSTLIEAKKIEPRLKTVCLFEQKPKGNTFCGAAKEIGAHDISPDYSLLTEQDVKECHANGIGVVPWTVNSATDWAKLIAMGVDGIITDYPKKLIDYLKANP